LITGQSPAPARPDESKSRGDKPKRNFTAHVGALQASIVVVLLICSWVPGPANIRFIFKTNGNEVRELYLDIPGQE
jgi:hypothetical protein